MAVLTTLQLSDGSAVGDNGIIVRNLKPLGGTGFSGPVSMYEFTASETGDASGGLSTLVVVPSPLYESVLVWWGLTSTLGGGPVEWLSELLSGGVMRARCFVNAIPVDGLNGQNHASWEPPPIFGFDDVRSEIVNPGAGATHIVNGIVYNFNLRASETVPLGILLSSLPRTSYVALMT